MKRRVKATLIYIAWGVLLNVVAAWGLAVSAHSRACSMYPVHSPHGGFPAALFVEDRFGHRHVQGVPRSGTLLSHYGDTVAPPPRLVWWPAKAVDIGHPQPCAIAAGWPLLSLGGWTTYSTEDLAGPGDPGVLIRARHHMAFEPRRGDTGPGRFGPYDADHPVIVPFGPLWPGFAINTAFYAALRWCLFAAPRAVRSTLRRRRGLCTRCAYPREDHAVCPECGRPHRRRMDSAAVAHAAPPA